VNRLPEKYRAPFVLCCLEGHSRAEAAHQLGWNEGTLSGRLALARKQLQRRLIRRGVRLTAALCAVALAPSAHAGVPDTLALATVESMMLFTAGKAGGVVSVHAIALAEGGLRAMSLTKMKIAMLLLLVLAVAGAGAGICTLQAFAGKPARGDRADGVRPTPPERDQPGLDRYGDALPPGALARLGTVRFRTRGGSPFPGNRFSPGVAFLPGDKTLVTLGADHTLRHWEAATGKEVGRFPTVGRADHGPGPFAGDGKVLALCVDKEVSLYEPATGKELRRFRYPAFVRHAALTPDGKTLGVFTGGEDKTLRLVDAATGKERLARKYPELIQVMAFSPDSDVLAIGLVCDQKTLQDGSVRLLDTATGNELHRLHLTDNATNFAFSPDSQTLATPEMHGITRLWEVATGKERAQFSDMERSQMAFSPDGRVLAAGDNEGTLHLCRAATGQELGRLRGHRSRSGITCLAFSPDGKTLASGSWDTTVLVWDVGGLLERKEEQPRELETRQLETLWTDLASDDAARAYQAIQELAVASRQAVPFLKERLRPLSGVEPKQIARLIADLDSGEFAAREKATSDLEKLGEAVEPSLSKALEGKPSLEVRRRAGSLLQKLRKESLGPERLRELRALEVLEQVGGTEVRPLVQRLAEGLPEARLTQSARGALERLDKRSR
jgi:hypothetical protein